MERQVPVLQHIVAVYGLPPADGKTQQDAMSLEIPAMSNLIPLDPKRQHKLLFL